MRKPGFLAFDLGASGGRAMFGTIKKGKLELQEVDRFATGMVNINGSWHWNIYRFFEAIKTGIEKSVTHRHRHRSIVSMAIDTWGVDFGLLSKEGELLGLPFAYRDSRTDGIMDAFFELMPREEVYRLTGIQFMQINSLFQLYSMKYRNSSLLEAAEDLLFIPDILNYFLTGEKNTEFSYATTSQLYNPLVGNWEGALFEKMGIPMDIMQRIVQPGTKIGALREDIAVETGVEHPGVYAAVSHDTGSAAAAVPAQGRNWAFISSGTWSLLGVESKTPVISDSALALNITNEGGIDSTFRVQKNITGLWIIQGLKESIKELRKLDYSRIAAGASDAPEFTAFIDPDHRDFLNPPDMREAMTVFFRRTGQPEPGTPYAFVRVALESLALKYRYAFEQLGRVCPDVDIEQIHIIGGGSQNEMLNQFTADAVGKPVLAGPAEATAIGNILVQARANGWVGSTARAREIVRDSFTIKEYIPGDTEKWDRAYEGFKEILRRNHETEGHF